MKAYMIGGQNAQHRIMTAIFEAFFSQGWDIAEYSVLADIAEETDLMTREDVRSSAYVDTQPANLACL